MGEVVIESIPRLRDPTLSWISQDFPQLEPWRELALEWLATIKGPNAQILGALSLFLDRFLVRGGITTEVDLVLRKETFLPDFFETANAESGQGVFRSNTIRKFLDFVLEKRFSTINPTTGKKTLNPNYHNPVPRRHTKTLEIIPDRPKGVLKTNDFDLAWVCDKYPHLEQWRILASEWIRGPGAQSGGIPIKLHALSTFLGPYLVEQSLPLEPPMLLGRRIQLPSFFDTCCPKSETGIRYNNYIHDFLEFVLLKECSEDDDNGRPIISPAFHNPVSYKGYSGSGRRYETNKVPLPYGYITRLRRQLIGGPNFWDWTWAQNALGTVEGNIGRPGPDWFQVTMDQIDFEDQDCVWRSRKTTYGEVLEMWSPVRWVALALKLLLPLRTFQVRMLDSGEGDTWSCESGSWVLNQGPLAQGKSGCTRRQGFLHRSIAYDGTITTQLYANTNKTADALKTGSDKGFVFPWITFGDQLDDVFYWAMKLRDWQRKYNPIDRLTSWTELDGRHIAAKSDAQLAGYPDTAFLFRMREEAPSERHLPLTDSSLDTCWFKLLETFEENLAKAGETLINGGRIRFLPTCEGKRKASYVTTNHPLHSLRVSIITALVLDGKVPIEVMQKIVGHSRLLMTIYYVVPGEANIRLTLEEAAKQLEAKADASTESFLLNTEINELMEKAICVNSEALRAAIPAPPGERNPVGWMMMADGCCLMGGNTSPTEGAGTIGGCYNGGPEIQNGGGKGHGSVPGGPRNCIRCRWFVTMPHYFYALVRRLNNLFWTKVKEQTLFLDLQREKDSLETERYDARQAGVPFERINQLRQVERKLESAASRLDAVIHNIIACTSLISRCEAALNHPPDGMSLVTIAGVAEIRTRLDGIDSELLQLTQVCEDLEVDSDLPPTIDAVLRRSQILDMALTSEGFKPLFLTMTEEQQVRNGNALMREMARRADPNDPIRGRVKVVTLMDLRRSLMEHLGFGLAECMPPGLSCEITESPNLIKLKINGRRNVLHDKHSS